MEHIPACTGLKAVNQIGLLVTLTLYAIATESAVDGHQTFAAILTSKIHRKSPFYFIDLSVLFQTQIH